MDDLVVVAIQGWITAHPVAAARLLALGFFLFVVGNVCKAIERSKYMPKSPRWAALVKGGAVLGNAVLGLYVLGKQFFHNREPSLDAAPSSGPRLSPPGEPPGPPRA